MTPAFFARLTVGNVPLTDLADEYQDWAVGEGPFERQRRGREECGLPRHATAESLDHSDDLTGTSDFAISIRHGDGIALLRLVHRDNVDDSVLWHNVVRLTAHGASTTIEHAIARTAPRGVILTPRAASPAVVKDLIDLHRAGEITPKDLYKARVVCSDSASAESFTSHVLLDKHRDVPLVIVTPSARSGAPVVDGELLARTLRGAAGIVEMKTRAATDALTFELEQAGLDRTFSCFDGGVRLYMPRLASKDERYKHPLWIRSWLESLAVNQRERTERLAGIIAGRIAEVSIPSDLLHCIQDFDREHRRKVAEALVATPAVPASALANAMLSQSNERNAEALEKEILDANALIDVYANDNQALSSQVATLRQQLAERDFAVQQATLRAESLEQIIEAKKRDANAGVPPEVRDAIAALLSKELTPEIALQLVATTWPERLIVLDTAYKAARKSEGFEDSEQVLHLLTKLTTEYFDALGSGGDAKAKSVFGKKEFAPTEAGLTKEGQKLRTFVYKEKKVEMLSHLKIGVKMDSFAKTLRIHFHWDGKERKLVVGHCGPHLDL